jgi:hypothetical protein
VSTVTAFLTSEQVMFSFLVETFSVPVTLRRMDLFIRSMMTSYRSVYKNFDEVLYLAGNHEAYGYNYEGTWDVLAEHLPKEIHILENDLCKNQGLGISWSNIMD